MTDLDNGKIVAEEGIEVPVVSHYWIGTFPFFEVTLFVVPPLLQNNMAGIGKALIEFFDPDGYPFNRVDAAFPVGTTGVVELAPLLGSGKFECGMKHAHVVVTSPAGTAHHCRMHTKEKAALLGAPIELNEEQPGFFPVQIAEDRSSFLALVNYSQEEAEVRCRLICGKRSPEKELSVPAMGVRLISIEDEFMEQSSLPEGKKMQAYIRLNIQSKSSVGALLVEQTRVLQDRNFFASVC